ncbi:hypothetical protein JCM3774_000883 [Rhodotorula dairenensis]
MASLATPRSGPALPWAQPLSDPNTATAFSGLSLRSFSPSGAGPTSATHLNMNRPGSASLRSSSRPLAVIQETSPGPHSRTIDLRAGVDFETGSSARLRATGLITPDSHGVLASLTPPALEPKPAFSTRIDNDMSPEDCSRWPKDGKASQVSPLSRLSRLWSEAEVPAAATSAPPTEVLSRSSLLQRPFETYQSTSPTLNDVAEPTKRRARLKPEPLQLSSEGETDSKRARRDSYPDILHGRRDSFTFHLPSDLGLDSPTPAFNKNGSYGSSALLHSPQPRRPSLVLASDHSTLADEPYTPCWGLEPIASVEHPPCTAAVTAPAFPFGFGQPFTPSTLGPTHTHSFPPQYGSRQEACLLEAGSFRPKTEVDQVSAQPGHAALVTVTSGPTFATAQSSDYPLKPSEVDRIAKLHNGRVPKPEQLAPPEHLYSLSHEPIINTGNQGPMVVQAGDWTCGVCGFINWRRRRVCLRCFPYANDVGKVLTIQSQRVAHLATPPSSAAAAAAAANGSYPDPSLGTAHMRVASAPVYPLDRDMYRTGIPSAELAVLARSTTYPPTNGGVPPRPATIAANLHSQVGSSHAPHPPYSVYPTQPAFPAHGPRYSSGQSPAFRATLPPSGPSPAPPSHPSHERQLSGTYPPMTPRPVSSGQAPPAYPYESTLAYWGMYNHRFQATEISPTSSTPSATSAGEFAARKRAAAVLGHSAHATGDFTPRSHEQHRAVISSTTNRQRQRTPPKGFLLIDDNYSNGDDPASRLGAFGEFRRFAC